MYMQQHRTSVIVQVCTNVKRDMYKKDEWKSAPQPTNSRNDT